MELRHLRSLVRIAEMGSFSRAAESLNIAQPALSQHIRQLEDELGVALLIRHSRGTKLSPAGEELLPEALKILSHIRSIKVQFANKRHSFRSELRLGLPTTVIRVLGKKIARVFESESPHINLEIVEGMTGHLYQWLRSGDLDAAILYDPIFYGDTRKNLIFYPIVQEDFSLIAPVGFFKEPPLLTPDLLKELPIALPRKLHAIRALITEFMELHDLRLNVLKDVDSFSLLIECVKEGTCTLLPAAAVAHELENGLVEAWQIQPSPSRTLNICFDKALFEELTDDPVIRQIIQVVHLLTSSGEWRAQTCSPTRIP
jgi:LysR family nitrogen assimilation transcriptional regulator